jgi:hypothetical protein
MAKLKLRVEMNKGRKGIPLGKLARITQETLEFLRMAYTDAELPGDPEGWFAYNFRNDSVDFDCECYRDIEADDVKRANSVFRAIMTNDVQGDILKHKVKPSTRRQYSKIAVPIDPDEKVTFGLFINGDTEPGERHDLTKRTAHDIEVELPPAADYYGEIQGTIHSLYKDDKPKRIKVRELSTQNLVDCFFEDSLYKSVIQVLEDRDGVVFVEGFVRENMANGIVESVQARAFRLAPQFDESKFNSLIGSAPSLTGKLTTEEFVERFRGNGRTAENLR